MKRRIVSIITALALCLSLCPTWALAAEADPSLCKHHPEHTEDCGYAAPTEGHNCGHEHGDECYSEETRCVHVHDESCYSDGLLPAEGEDKAADTCTHACTAESGCVTRTLDCHHSHDSECGYVQADPGTSCGYECRICPIEDLIAALPDKVTADNAADVRAQLEEILALYGELNEDEQGQLDLSRCYELQEALDRTNAPMMAEGTGTSYIDAGRNEQTAVCTPLESSGISVGLSGGWYVVDGDVTIDGTLAFDGETHLVLADGCKLTVRNIDTTNLTIYGQSQGTGTLIAGGADVLTPAIGHADPVAISSQASITINGGCVNAYSDTDIAPGYSQERSVIGGYYNSYMDSVTINGGVVYAVDAAMGSRCFPKNRTTRENCIVGYNGVATVYGNAGLPDAVEIGINDPSIIDSLKSIYISSGATLTSLGKYKAYPIDMYDLLDDDKFNITLKGGINAASTDQEIRNAIQVTSPYTDIGHIGAFTIAGLTTEDVTTIARNDDGTCTAIFTKNGKTVTKTFSLNKGQIHWINVTLPMYSYAHTGSAIEPEVTVKVDGKVLTEGTDYTVKYTNNTNIGEATVTVTGIGNYEGTAEKTFTINDADTLIEVEYVDESGQVKTAQAKAISASTDSQTLKGGWYFVQGAAQRGTIIAQIMQDSYLILPDGCSLNVTKALSVEGNLTIYGQSGNSGKLTVKNGQTSNASLSISTGNLTVNGGNLSVKKSFGGPAIELKYRGYTFTYNGTSENFTVDGDFNSSGTLQTERLTEDMIVVDRTNLPKGSSEDLSAEVGQCVTLKDPTYAGKTFTLTGWTQSSVAKVDDTTYTVTYTHTQRGTVRKTVTLDPPCAHPNLTYQDQGDGTCGGTCPDCNQEVKEPHQWSEAGVCGNCHTQAVAKVRTDDGVESYYTTIETAWSAARTASHAAVVTLLANVTLTGELSTNPRSEESLTPNITFNGGNHTVTGYPGQRIFFVKSGSTLTITGGTFTAKPDEEGRTSGCVDVKSGGTLIVTDGTLKLEGISGYMLIAQSGSTTRLSGGTFTGGATPVLCQDGLFLKDLLLNYGSENGPYYAFYQDGKPYAPSGSSLPSGTFTVQECQHTGVEVTDLGGGKHGLTCPYCGYHSEHTTTLTATASGNTVTLNEGCGTEGCNYAAELGTVSFTFENLVYGNPNAKVSRIKDGPASLGVMLKIDNAGDYAIQGEDTTYSYSLIALFASTPMTAGDHTLKMLFYDDSNMGTETVECELPFTVAKAPLTPVIDASNGSVTKPYDGTTAALEGLAITLTGLVEGDNVTATASYAYDNANAGERTITATSITLTGADAGNYTLTTNSATIKGTITKAPQDAPTPPTAAEVNDTSITLSIIANAEYSKDGTNWQASPTFTGLDPNRAYTFYARLKEDGNHNASPSSTASITTRKMMLDNATVTVGGSYTYTGAAQTPAVAVVKNGKTLTAGTDYTVSYANNTNAGTATVTITGMGDYEGTNSTTFTIQRKTLTVAGAIAAGRPYNGTNTVTITGVTLDGIVGNDAVSVDTADLTGTLNGSNVGSYTAVTLPALTLTGGGADNYTLTRPAGAVSTSVTISKAAARTPKTGDLAVANKQAHTYTFGLGALRPDLPAGMSFGSSAVTYELGAVSLGSYYDSSANSAKIEGQTLTLPIQAVESNEAEGIGTITVTIHTGNFEDMTATINVRSVNKTIPTGAPTLSAATLTYGQPLSTITLRGDMAAGATPVPGKFEWSSPDNRPAVQEAYAAAWVFTPTDNNTYAIVNGTSTIKVVPASITGAVVTLSPTSFRYDGQTHSPTVTSVKLGDTTLTADTDYTVEIPTETAAGTYTITITGKGNYTGTATATFTINPVETGDEFEDESGTTLRLEVETGLSTVPEALKNNAKYDTPAKIEAELRTWVELAMSNVGENIAVFDVTLQYKDESGAWHTVDPNDFPTEGVTAILPYPDGTGATGYTFTVQHLISSGTQTGTMETLSYTLTADGLQCKFLSLSPVAIGYQAAAKPVDPVNPNPGGGSGGWSGVSTYAVTIEKSEHGKVTSNRTNAGNGSTVTLTVTPEDGYVLDTLTVTDSRGNAIKLTAQGNGKYTFTMPGRAVMVRAAFAPLPDGTACDGGEGCPSRGFTDLGSVGTWYHEAVDYVLRNNLMGGYGNGLFGPNDTLTRAQFAQILYNKEGRPAVTGGGIFTDVAPGAWCAPAITWAAERSIVGGYGNGMFGPNDNITREQLAVMLWRYAGSPAATDKELHFNDADKASGYALDALRWAVENGIINGKGGGILDPKGLATRAQTAQMLKNFIESQEDNA